MHHILDEIDAAETEVFPKQDALLPDSGNYGNFINAPLFARLVRQRRTVFVEPAGAMEPYSNQWTFLESVQRVTEETLDDIIEVNELDQRQRPGSLSFPSLGVFQSPLALPLCAQKMLEHGVTSYQWTSCFRLAVHLRKLGLPFDITVAALQEWANKNRPSDHRRVITLREIKAQTAAAFLKDYQGCGCEDPAIKPHCDTTCPIYSGHVGQANRDDSHR